MTPETKSLTLQVLRRALGDDLYRAQQAFKNFTPHEMNMEYGHSGTTRQAIVDGYQKRYDEIQAAISEIEGL